MNHGLKVVISAAFLVTIVTQPATVRAPSSIEQLGGTSIEQKPPEPVESNQIVPASRSDKQEKSEPAEDEPVPDTETYTVTAYTAGPESTGKRPDDPGYGITASGEPVQAGVTVACPPDLPFGTEVMIEDIGERVCHDRGGAIRGNRIDVYMTDLDDALQFGRQTLEVEVRR